MYEDGIYYLLTQSVMKDLDYNLINQIDKEYGWLLTSQYYYPSHHSEIQTPAMGFFLMFEKVLGSIFGQTVIVAGIPTGLLMSFLLLAIAFIYQKETFKELGIDYSLNAYLVFIFSTVLFYFSFFTVNVIEVFAFSLSSFCICQLVKIRNGRVINSLLLGVFLALLLISKMTYAPLFLVCIGYYLYKKKEGRASLALGSILVIIPFLLNQYVLYGEIIYFGSSFAKNVNVYSWPNLITTLKQGYFGEGGLFYSNPIFLPIILVILATTIRNIWTKKFEVINLLMCLWLMLSLFQTLFIAGPVFEDHLVGRIFLTALPVLIYGQVLLIQKFKENNFLLIFSSITLILWQIIVTSNYFVLSALGHYKYASQKSIQLSEHLKRYNDLFVSNADAFGIDFVFVLVFVFLMTFVVYASLRWEELAKIGFERLILASAVLLVAYSGTNAYSGHKTKSYYESNREELKDYVIGTGPDAYMFIYVMDIFETQLRNSKSSEMRKIILKKRTEYYERVKEQFSSKTPEFQKILENMRFDNSNYNIYLNY